MRRMSLPSLLTEPAPLLALLAERSRLRGSRVLQLLALAPIVTPPFVVGLGLILLFGRAGVVNAGLEAWLGIEPTQLRYLDS